MKSVLIIDDDKTILELLAEILKDAGLNSVLAVDGALGMLKAKNQQFQLIITDLNMPKMNGVQFLDNLYNAKDVASKNIPVIVITGNISKFAEDLKKYPLVSVLEKPFAAEELVKLVQEKIAQGGSSSSESGGKRTTVERTPFARGQLVYSEGTSAPGLWMVVEGKLVSFRSINNQEVTLLEHGPGEIIGAAAVIGKVPSSVGVRAVEDSLLVQIPAATLLAPLESLPKLVGKAIADLAHQQLVLTGKVAQLRS